MWRRPKGRNCAPCRNTFHSGGWALLKDTPVLTKYNNALGDPTTVQSKCHGKFLHERDKLVREQVARLKRAFEAGKPLGRTLR